MAHTCNWCGKRFTDGYDSQYCSERCFQSYSGDDDWVAEYDKKKAKIDKYLSEIMKE